MAPKPLHLAPVLACLLPLAASPAQEFSLVEDFEGELPDWVLGDTGTLPLTIVDDPVFSGAGSAYSGPPGGRHVVSHTPALPLLGRLEVRFYDDMAPRKQQIAAASGGPGELLGIVCRGGTRYQCRVGQTYTEVPVERTEGWHHFAWECDGRRTVAFIDGQEVFANESMGRIRKVSLGSFWDDSTGWYDELRATPIAPTTAGPVVEAEDAFRQDGPPGASIRRVPKAGASGLAINHWDAEGHALEWVLGSTDPDPKVLLLKYATDSPQATRTLGDRSFSLEGTGGWDKWAYAAVPIDWPAGTRVLRLVNAGGSLNLDWLALAPADIDPEAAGPALDRWLRAAPWLGAAAQQLALRAEAEGVEAPSLPARPEHLDALPSGPALEAAATDVTEGLTETVRTLVAPELSTLDGIYRVREPEPLGPETRLSREYYRRLLRYVRYTDSRVHDWPYLEGCRYHKVDDHNEMAVRQNATVALGYATLLAGDYNARVAGVSREKIAEDLNALLRYITVTHKANYLPTGDGTAWGDQWQSAFWARIAGTAAWTAWADVDNDVRLMVAGMVCHEADRFNERLPDSGVMHDTKAEENAWNSEVIALAACMFPDHPNNALWQERAIVYMVNSLTRESDLTEERVVDGRPVSERVTAVTIHPDFTLENHNRVHPDYMGTIGLLLRNAIVYPRAGMELPESVFYNVREVWAVLKGLTATNGSYFYVNGQDWWPHRHDGPLTVGGLMSAVCGDPDAGFVERSGLKFTGRMHARFEDGSMWHPREYNYRNAEEEMIARYSELYMIHRIFGDGPKASTGQEYLRNHSGVRAYERGGFVFHRTPVKLCSFAWVNGAMGLVYPRDDTWFTSPSERGMVGRITCEGVKDTTPVVEERTLKTEADGFALAARIARCEGKVEQAIALFSLPEGPCIYLERLIAREDLQVTEVATATVPMLNEDAPGISPNRRTVHRAGQRAHIAGLSDEPPRFLEWPTGWANIEGMLGVVSTCGTMAYRDNNAYSRSRLEEELIANFRGSVGAVEAGGQFSACAVAFIPNQAPAATERTTLEWSPTQAGVIVARLGKTVVAANLGSEAADLDAFDFSAELEPLQTALLAP